MHCSHWTRDIVLPYFVDAGLGCNGACGLHLRVQSSSRSPIAIGHAIHALCRIAAVDNTMDLAILQRLLSFASALPSSDLIPIVNQRSKPFGTTPLLMACARGWVDGVDALLHFGADTSIVATWDALSTAVLGHTLDLSYPDASADEPPIFDSEFLTIAMRSSQHEPTGHHNEAYVGTTAPSTADSRLAIVKLLVERGSVDPAAEVDGRTAFHWAAFSGQVPIMRYLVEECGLPVDLVAGATSNASGSDDQRQNHHHQDAFAATPLGIACSTFHRDPSTALHAVEYLLAAGADANLRPGLPGRGGCMPLGRAIQEGSPLEMLKLLVDVGGAHVKSNVWTSADPYSALSTFCYRSAFEGGVGVLKYLLRDCGCDADGGFEVKHAAGSCRCCDDGGTSGSSAGAAPDTSTHDAADNTAAATRIPAAHCAVTLHKPRHVDHIPLVHAVQLHRTAEAMLLLRYGADASMVPIKKGLAAKLHKWQQEAQRLHEPA